MPFPCRIGEAETFSSVEVMVPHLMSGLGNGNSVQGLGWGIQTLACQICSQVYPTTALQSRSNVCFRDLLSQRSVHHHDSEGFAYLWLEGNDGK